MARNKIDVIIKRIDMRETSNTFQQSCPSLTHLEESSRANDFRASLQNANKCIEDLESLTRSGTSLSQGFPSPPSSSTKPNSQPAPPSDLNNQRIAVMSKLTSILRTNMRVGYELNFNDVLHACVTYSNLFQARPSTMYF